jgi:hypothetical protein
MRAELARELGLETRELYMPFDSLPFFGAELNSGERLHLR